MYCAVKGTCRQHVGGSIIAHGASPYSLTVNRDAIAYNKVPPLLCSVVCFEVLAAALWERTLAGVQDRILLAKTDVATTSCKVERLLCLRLVWIATG
jgi:hypothetical protein